MIAYTDSLEKIVADFKSSRIPVDAPGFYDHPAFSAREARNPDYLNNYARFVMARDYDLAYLEMAEKRIHMVCDIMYEELVRDGRLGACVDMSMVISRILDKLGVWNFPVKGAVTTYYPEATRIPTGYFWPIDTGAAKAGHAWVCAPPFAVIDITIGKQAYGANLSPFVPPPVFSRQSSDVLVFVEDICSDTARAQMRGQGFPPTMEGLYLMCPQLRGFFSVFKGTLHEHNGALIKYIPTAIAFSDEPLEEITALRLSGKYGNEIFREKIAPLFS